MKYQAGEKYGLVSIDGKEITSAIYDSIETLEYKDGVLRVPKRWQIWTYKHKWRRNCKTRIQFDYNRWVL